MVAPLLFVSGACALVYQTVWLRELRHVFGGSTAATAAVLAVFLGGLGLGASRLGRRAESSPSPLAFYGRLELWISVLAAASLALLFAIRAFYVWVGGSPVLGAGGATVLRLLLTVVVLGPVTFLMGGTLPAAARAVETHEDEGRGATATLYGLNTLGAVAGVGLSTFWLIEHFGHRTTLLGTTVVNMAAAMLAIRLAQRRSPASGSAASADAERAGPPGAALIPRWLVLAVAGASGFVFLLMELVWYRMLSPVLGGSTYSFGLILAVALFGIGSGGWVYAAFARRRPRPQALALSCAFLAAALAFPFFLGDRVAFFALHIRPLGQLGYSWQLVAWLLPAILVLFPAAFVSGVQFPLLIAFLGAGERRVGNDVGQAYAWNTVGAIAGSLLGGMGLLTLLSATGSWRLGAGVMALAALALVFPRLGTGPTPERRIFRTAGGALAAVAGLVILSGLRFAQGPTAVWRETGIGAGRAAMVSGPLQRRAWEHSTRRQLLWQVDGRESTVGAQYGTGLGFTTNGKADGHIYVDAPTQVMAGLVGAAVHPAPRRGLVIGLGTGSTGGWLASVPAIERVDIIELEPAVARVARAASLVNNDVLNNPKAHLSFGDGREWLLAGHERYDLIVSAPSHPYRAGVAGLFTRDFYRAVEGRLEPGGLFLQWMQLYEVDAATVRSVCATMAAVFPAITTWQTREGSDLLLVGSREPLRWDAERLRRTLSEEPFRSALAGAWRAEGLEGFLAGFVAEDDLIREIALEDPGAVNTDDRNVIEFRAARSVGRGSERLADQIRDAARTRGLDRPALVGVDWTAVEEQRMVRSAWLTGSVPSWLWLSPEQRIRGQSVLLHARGDLPGAERAWTVDAGEPAGPHEISARAEMLAFAGKPEAARWIAELRSRLPVEADAIEARWLATTSHREDAIALLERALIGYRRDPWASPSVMGRSLDLAFELATAPAGEASGGSAARLDAALSEPFAGLSLEERRLRLRVEVDKLQGGRDCSARLGVFEPFVPWEATFLEWRLECYGEDHPLSARARRDLSDYRAAEAAPFGLPAGSGARQATR